MKFFVFMRGLRRFSSNRFFKNDGLSRLKKNYDIEEKQQSNLEIPQGVGEVFYYKLKKLETLPNTAPFTSVLDIANLSKTEQEVSKFQGLLSLWLKNRFISRRSSSELIELLLKNKQNLFLFELLSNRFKYKLLPDASHISQLLDFYSKEFLKNIKISTLDNMYKAFSLFLYYDIPPTVHHYHTLISTGLFSQNEEASKRAFMCLDELKYLGWECLPETLIARAHYHNSRKEFDDTLIALEGVPVSNTKLSLQIEALIGKGDVAKAEKLLGEWSDDTGIIEATPFKTKKELAKLLEN